MAADLPDLDGADHLRRAPDPGALPVQVVHEAGQQGRQRHGLEERALRRAALAAHVLAALPDLPGDAAAQQALHGRLFAQHRRAQPHQLQHPLRAQDAHDHLSRHRAARLHGLPLDHCQLDSAPVRTVSAYGSEVSSLKARSFQVSRRGARQPPQRHVAHRHHVPQRRLRRHRAQHLLRQGHCGQHGNHGIH